MMKAHEYNILFIIINTVTWVWRRFTMTTKWAAAVRFLDGCIDLMYIHYVGDLSFVTI